MYGLQNILTEQGVTLEQQCIILELLLSANCFEPLHLVISLSAAGFSRKEADRILAHTLHAIHLAADKFDPRYLLSALAAEDRQLKEKTRRWFETTAKKVFIEQHEALQAHITPAMLQAFAPQPPQPQYNSYDTVIILDGPEQPITDGLDYLKHLLDTQQLKAGKILIPAVLTPQDPGAATPSNSAKEFRDHLLNQPTYLKLYDLHTRVTQDARLTREKLGDFLADIYAKETGIEPDDAPQIYKAIYRLSRSNRILMITTEKDADSDRYAVTVTHEALPQCKIETEVIYALKKKDFTANDLAHLLVERFCPENTPDQQPIMSTSSSAAAAGTTTTAGGSTQTRESSPAIPSSAIADAAAADEKHAPTNRGLFAVSIATVGIFAAANPEITTAIADAAKELAMTAVKAVFQG